MDKLPDIYDFTDYRLFLQTYSEYKKSTNKHWSYQSWALRIGLKNNTSILKILNGQREAGKQIQNKLIKYFNFDAEQEKFFSYLIELSKSKEDLEKTSSIRKTLKKQFNVVLRKTIDEKVFSAFSSWVSMVIRQTTKLKNFDFQLSTLRSNLVFDLPLYKLENAFKNLEQIGLIENQKVSNKIVWSKKDFGIKTSQDVMSKSIQDYHKNILKISSEALDIIPVKKREFSSTAIAIRQSDLTEIKIFLRNFEEEFCNKFEQKNIEPDQVYVLNLQFFPLTKFNPGGDL